MEFADLLKLAQAQSATDILLKTGSCARIRVGGDLQDLDGGRVILDDLMLAWIGSILPKRLQASLNQSGDVDFSYRDASGQRFRINLYRQRQSFSMAIRIISSRVYKIDELGLPMALEDLALKRRGLILVTGATGSGKSTTLAAMIQHINRKRRAHIVTVEDPIEFDFVDKKSTISQREVGLDVGSFEVALRGALRQNPDVIAVGELRDKVTIETALKAAETGHLVLSTLHTSDSVETLTRLMSYFPPEQQRTVRMQLAATLQAIISQRLIKTRDKSKRVAANEILMATGLVRDIILREDSFGKLHDAIQQGRNVHGMLSFDDSLLQLHRDGLISSREALNNASRPNDLNLRLSGIGA